MKIKSKKECNPNMEETFNEKKETGAIILLSIVGNGKDELEDPEDGGVEDPEDAGGGLDDGGGGDEGGGDEGGEDEGGEDEGGEDEGGEDEGGEDEGGEDEGGEVGDEQGGSFDEGTTEGTDGIPGDSQYDGDTWGVYNGFGSPANPIQLHGVSITPANKNDGSAWGSLGKVVVGVIEVVSGVLLIPESGGAGIYLVIDGFGRTGLNLANFINEIKGNNVPELPSNFLGAIGLGFSNEKGAYYGAILNDVVTALVGGGLYPDAEEAIDAIIEKQYFKAVAAGTTAVDDDDTITEWFKSH